MKKFAQSFLILLAFIACNPNDEPPKNKTGSPNIQQYQISTKVYDKDNGSAIADADVYALLEQNEIGAFKSDSNGMVNLYVQVQSDEFNLDKIKIKTVKQGYNELIVKWVDIRNDSTSIALMK